MVLLLIFSIWSEMSHRVAHYQAHSSYLVLKFFHSRLRKNPEIEGIRVGAGEIKIAQYADDTTVFLKNPESMSVLLDLLEKFETCSGLKINCTKSEAMWLRKWKNREDTPFNVKWPKDSVFALGIHFSNSEKVSGKIHLYEKLDVLEKTLNNHSFMRECYSTGLSLRICRVIKRYKQRKRLYGITKTSKLITRRSFSVLGLIKAFIP